MIIFSQVQVAIALIQLRWQYKDEHLITIALLIITIAVNQEHQIDGGILDWRTMLSIINTSSISRHQYWQHIPQMKTTVIIVFVRSLASPACHRIMLSLPSSMHPIKPQWPPNDPSQIPNIPAPPYTYTSPPAPSLVIGPIQAPPGQGKEPELKIKSRGSFPFQFPAMPNSHDIGPEKLTSSI